MKHALLSASGSHRWLHCTPSARLTESYEDTTSTYAAEGTLAHELAELMLTYAFKLKGDTKAAYLSAMALITERELYSPEMFEYIKGFVDFVREEYAAVKALDPNAIINFEQRLDYSAYVPEGFGTGDVVIAGAGIVQIIDLKYGKGVRVDCVDNTQLMLYGLGALLWASMLWDVKEVRTTIYQPRMDNISTYELCADSLLEWAENELKPKAELAWDGAGDFVPGDHCRFCKAKPTCRALAEHNLKLQAYEYKKGPHMTNAEIADILKISDRLKNWAESIKAHALKTALDGAQYEGWKVVEGTSRRRYTDESAIKDALKAKRFRVRDICESKLLSIGKLEKVVGKSLLQELAGDFIDKPPGKPTLVPSDDPRKPFNDAVADFAHVDTDKYKEKNT